MCERFHEEYSEHVSEDCHDGNACYDEAAVQKTSRVVLRGVEGVGNGGTICRVGQGEEWNKVRGHPFWGTVDVHISSKGRVVARTTRGMCWQERKEG